MRCPETVLYYRESLHFVLKKENMFSCNVKRNNRFLTTILPIFILTLCVVRIVRKNIKTQFFSSNDDLFTKNENSSILSYNSRQDRNNGGEEMREVYHLIRKLGATSKYKGYYFVAEAVRISMEAQERPIKITKDIYPFLAKKFKSTPMNVEHDIRTVINVCWMANKKTMDEIAGYSLSYKPTNSEFVDMLAYYLSQIKEIPQHQEQRVNRL